MRSFQTILGKEVENRVMEDLFVADSQFSAAADLAGTLFPKTITKLSLTLEVSAQITLDNSGQLITNQL